MKPKQGIRAHIVLRRIFEHRKFYVSPARISIQRTLTDILETGRECGRMPVFEHCFYDV